MIDKDEAMQAVRVLYDALVSPEEAIERADMGALHAALAPRLKEWTARPNRRPLMASSAGSLNYDLVVETSDLDLKAVYLPDIADFYHGRFPKFSFTTPRFDAELHPVHQFVQHALKGNINFFEFLWAEAALADPYFIPIMTNMVRPLVLGNIQRTTLATFWTADNAHKNWSPKKGATALRCLVFVIQMLDCGQFELKPAEPFRSQILRLKREQMGWEEYEGLYQELRSTAVDMAFAPDRKSVV